MINVAGTTNIDWVINNFYKTIIKITKIKLKLLKNLKKNI